MTEKRFFLVLLLVISVVFTGFSDEGGNNFPSWAIINASYAGDENMVRELLEAGVDTDVRDALGATALHAATLQSNLVVVKLLLDHGFDPNVRASKSGNTPLHYAVASNNVGAARLLLQYNANKNIRNFDGLTPLERARREGKTEIARVLLR